jgi:hypothetical protein
VKTIDGHRRAHGFAQAPRADGVAAFLLAAADTLGIKVGYVGDDVITVAPGVSPELSYWLHVELAKRAPAVIAIIEDENAARRGELVPDAFEEGGAA